MSCVMATETPKSLRPLLHNSFTPFLSNGEQRKTCCGACRSLLGYETALEKCSSSLFRPVQVEKLDADEPDVETAQRILDAIENLRNDLHETHNILPSSPYEGMEFREKLKELDRLGDRILEAEQQRASLVEYTKKKQEHERLRESLARQQVESERAAAEKRRKGHLLQRKTMRRQVLEEEASVRQLRREERAERRHRRELEGVNRERLLATQDSRERDAQVDDTESLLPQHRGARGGGVIRRIRDVEIPEISAEFDQLQKEISVLDQTINEYSKTKDQVRELEAYLTSTISPEFDFIRNENDRGRLAEIRRELLERSPRMFGHLLLDKPENHVSHEKDFDLFYESIDKGLCTCGTPFYEHLVLVSCCPNEASRLEDQLRKFVVCSRSAE